MLFLYRIFLKCSLRQNLILIKSVNILKDLVKQNLQRCRRRLVLPKEEVDYVEINYSNTVKIIWYSSAVSPKLHIIQDQH